MFTRLALLVSLLCVASVRADEAAKLLPADKPIEQVIDHYIAAALKEAKIEPAYPADDATFIRRVTLDLNGRIPTIAETAAYLAAPAASKRAELVDRLLDSPAFARDQAQEFFTFLQSQDDPRQAGKRTPLYTYLLTCFRENRAWDRMFREMMLPDENEASLRGAGEFLKARAKDANRMTIDASTTFFRRQRKLCAMPQSSPRAGVDPGPLLRHEELFRPDRRDRRLSGRA